MIIGIDLERTIADYDRFMNKWQNIYTDNQASTGNYKPVFAKTSSDMTTFWEHYRPVYIANVDCVNYAPEGIGHLLREHQVYIITSRPESTREQTVAWLYRHGVAFTNIVFNISMNDAVKILRLDCVITGDATTLSSLSTETLPVGVIALKNPSNLAYLKLNPDTVIANQWMDIGSRIESFCSVQTKTLQKDKRSNYFIS